MKIFIADQIANEGVQFLKQHTEFQVDFSPGLDQTQVCEHIKDCDAVIVRSTTHIDDTILAAGEQLKVIGRAGIGVDNIDVEKATERGIVVLNAPDANATTTAELAIAHILSLCRNLPLADQSVRKGRWERSKFLGAELTGKTLGIIGYGTIGRIVAMRGQGLKMKVIAYDPFVADAVFEEACVESRDLESLLAEADIVTLHCPLVKNTRGLINAERLKIMKPGSRLVNCARGGLIDETALYDALHEGHLAGAALDVFEDEPPTDLPLFRLDNIVFTPHLGASTQEAQVAVGMEIVKQVATFLDSGEAVNAVNLPSLATEFAVKIRPYQALAKTLSRLLARMTTSAVTGIEISLLGQIAEYDSHPVGVAALSGLLNEYLSIPVNEVNAVRLAHRQGIQLVEKRSDEAHRYLSTLTVKARTANEVITVSGTLFENRLPRLVRINDYELEAPLAGNLLFIRHVDQPGVVGGIGAVLGDANINISHMQVGVVDKTSKAIAVIGISKLLDDKTMAFIFEIPAINKVMQLAL